jgi:hypothetical protein
MLRDAYTELSASLLMTTKIRTADANSTGIDLAGSRGLLLIADIGDTGDTLSGSIKIEMEVEHSDDNSSWSDCADADLVKSVTGTNTGTFAVIDDNAEDETVYTTSYIGSKRYVRVVANFTGTHTNGTEVGVIAVKTHQMKA